MAKMNFKINGINVTVDGNPITIENVEITTEADVHEIATSGGFINQLVETIDNIAERFDNGNRTPVEEIKVKVKEEPVEVKPEPITDFCEIKVKEKTKKPELPTSSWSGGQPVKKFNITKAWRAIPVPKSMKKTDKDQYRWEGEKGLLSDSVSINGATFGAVYIHVYGMKKRAFIVVRNDNVEFEDDIRPEEFQDFLDAISIPGDIKEYIQKVISL